MDFIVKRPFRTRKNRDVDEDIISEKFLFRIENWAKRSDKEGFELSTRCSLCDKDWLITFKGSTYYTDYSSVYITNLSGRRLRASYVITLKNTRSGSDITFTDPEETVIFEVDGDGDNSWGNDELVLSSYLRDNKSGFIHDDCIQIEIEIKICGIVKASSTPLSQAIESAIDVDDLIALADKEIDPFRIRYKVSNSEMLANHENILLTSRLPATPVPQLNRRRSTSYGRKR